MNNHYEYSDQELEDSFSDKTFPVKLFTHEAHLRLAYIHIKKYGVNLAVENLCSQIKTYAEFHGANNKYNATVTYASLHILLKYIGISKTDKFHDLTQEFPVLLYDFKKEIQQYYSWDVFESSKAKKEIFQPDVIPFTYEATVDR